MADEETSLLADMRARIDGIKAKIEYHNGEIKQHGEIINTNTRARDRMAQLLRQYEYALDRLAPSDDEVEAAVAKLKAKVEETGHAAVQVMRPGMTVMAEPDRFVKDKVNVYVSDQAPGSGAWVDEDEPPAAS